MTRFGVKTVTAWSARRGIFRAALRVRGALHWVVANLMTRFGAKCETNF